MVIIKTSNLNTSSFYRSKFRNNIIKKKILNKITSMERIDNADNLLSPVVNRKHDFINLSFEKLRSQLTIETATVW